MASASSSLLSSSSSSSSANLIAGNAEFEAMRASYIDEALLISLLEESQVEEPEEERLSYVMRSLQAEIDQPDMIDGRAPAVAPEGGGRGNCEDYCSSGLYASPTRDFDWLDMEMASSSPSGDMGNWYMDSYSDELAGMLELGEVRDYSHFCYAAPLEEHAYSSLWQETYDSMMYD